MNSATLRSALFLLLLPLLAAALPGTAAALVFPMSLTDRILASDAIVLVRVVAVADRATSDVVAEINEIHRSMTPEEARIARARVPRRMATVQMLERIKGRNTMTKTLKVLYGIQSEVPAKKPIFAGSRILMYLKSHPTPGTWAVVNWPYGAVGCSGENELDDGSTLAQVRALTGELCPLR